MDRSSSRRTKNPLAVGKRVCATPIGFQPSAADRSSLISISLPSMPACAAGADQWWQRAFGYDRLPDPEQGVEALKDFCLHHLLYEAGDVPAFRRVYEVLEEEGQLEGDDRGRFLLKLTQYLDHTLRSAGPADRLARSGCTAAAAQAGGVLPQERHGSSAARSKT